MNDSLSIFKNLFPFLIILVQFILLYFNLLNFISIYSILFHFIPFNSFLFYFIRFSFLLFQFISFHFNCFILFSLIYLISILNEINRIGFSQKTCSLVKRYRLLNGAQIILSLANTLLFVQNIY